MEITTHLAGKRKIDYKNHFLVRFEGLNDINLVEKYKGSEVFISEDDQEELPDGEYIARFIKGDARYLNSIYYPESLKDLFESFHRLRTDEEYYKSMSNTERWDKVSELEEAITIGLVNLLTIYFPGEFTEAYEIEGADDHSTDPTEE